MYVSVGEEQPMTTSNLIKHSLAGVLVLAAAGFPCAAQAMPNRSGGAVEVPQAAQQTQPGGSSEFQWGDAGIGAAAAIVLVGSGVAVSGGRRRRHAHQHLAG
jgi:hypothetical protein